MPTHKHRPDRILIVGDAGRGKTTLAEKLSKILGIPKHSTDDYYYEVKFSKPRNKQESLEAISKLFHEDRWIVEGTTQSLWRSGLEPADIILLLEHKNIFFQWYSLLKRHLGRRDEETLGQLLSLMKHVFCKRFSVGSCKGKQTNAEVVAPYGQKVIILRTFREVDEFVERFR